MFCRYCGTEINDNVRFCPTCGKETGTCDLIVSDNIEPASNDNNTTNNKNPNPSVVYVTNEIKNDKPMSCIGCLGYIFLFLIIMSILGSCVA